MPSLTYCKHLKGTHVTARTRARDSIPFGSVEESMDAINPDLLAVQSAIGAFSKVAFGTTSAPWLAQGFLLNVSVGEVSGQFDRNRVWFPQIQGF